MRVVVTGREGQLVRSLIERAVVTNDEVIALGRPAFDLVQDEETITSVIEVARPDILVSAAAYTLVDKAESESDLAFVVNERGVRHIARAAATLSVPLIHLSTDYVFDGSKGAPYSEEDPTAPMGVYGASKLAGERAVLEEHADSVILRTAWVYSPFGANFVKAMLRLAAEQEEVGVVADQIGNPTSAFDIADGILAIANNLYRCTNPEQRGIFHMVGEGEASWAEFAEAIFLASAQADGPVSRVKRITTADYPTPARRPRNSRLISEKLKIHHGVRLPSFRFSLPAVVQRLVRTEHQGEYLR